MIYGGIVNYLPASLVGFRPLVKFTRAGSMWVAGLLSRITGFPGLGIISTQRRDAIAGEGLGYVRSEVIGVEGKR
jgi:hypothetical protein